MKRALNSASTPNDVTSVGKRALTNKRQRLEGNSVIANNNALNGEKTITNSPMQQGMYEELYTYPSRDTNNGPHNTEPDNHVHYLSGKHLENESKFPT